MVNQWIEFVREYRKNNNNSMSWNEAICQIQENGLYQKKKSNKPETKEDMKLKKIEMRKNLENDIRNSKNKYVKLVKDYMLRYDLSWDCAVSTIKENNLYIKEEDVNKRKKETARKSYYGPAEENLRDINIYNNFIKKFIHLLNEIKTPLIEKIKENHNSKNNLRETIKEIYETTLKFFKDVKTPLFKRMYKTIQHHRYIFGIQNYIRYNMLFLENELKKIIRDHTDFSISFKNYHDAHNKPEILNFSLRKK